MPPEIAQLAALKTLSLNRNQLTALPPEIAQLTALQSLLLNDNQLTALPPEIGQLTALQGLYLTGNQLTALPPEIAQLTALKTLFLSRNLLTVLPPEIAQLSGLESGAERDDGLWVNENPLPQPYPTLIAQGQPSATLNVLAWLRGELDPTMSELVAHPPNPSEETNVTLPQEPLPEAGPIFSIESGKLDLVPGPETSEVFDRTTQAALHRRIIRQIEPLRAETAKVGNRHPGLALTVEEYAKLVSKPFDDLDVTDLWAVGNGLLAHAFSFEKQDERRTLTEPLEPSHLALLLDVARLHGGFILGFPKGIELTERADRAQLGPNAIRAINDPTLHVLAALSQQTKLVSERARRLTDALNAALIVAGWETTRIGYTSYATVRNALIQLGKVIVWVNDKGGSLAGGIVIGSAIAASGLTPETLELVVHFLQTNVSDVLAFAAPFPELRAWIGWIIDHFDEERNATSKAKRPKSDH